MSLLVQKFGGSSLESLDNIKSIAQKIKSAKQAGHDIIVVASAMGGETDKLVLMAQELAETLPDPREFDVLLSSGEQISVSLLAIALNAIGCPAITYLGSQIKILTDEYHGKAQIKNIEPDKILQSLRSGKVVVVPGFQGVSSNGDITTLGRGGSDTTAVALAAALQADECQIYTDVDGVHIADPRIVPKAELLTEVGFSEMLELSSLGAKVLQIRAVELAGKKNVPMRVLSSFGDDTPGTVISYDEPLAEQQQIAGIVVNADEAFVELCGLPNVPLLIADILQLIGSANIEIDLMVQKVTRDNLLDIGFSIPKESVAKVKSIISSVVVKYDIQAFHINEHVAKISVVGMCLRTNPLVTAKVYKTLAALNVHMHILCFSETKVSAIIDEKSIDAGVKALHSAFALEQVEV